MLGTDAVIDRMQKTIIPEELTGIFEKISLADELCKAYTHVNRDVVKVGLLLMMLQCKGLVHGGMDGLLTYLADLSMEDRIEICHVITQAQSEYAAGEAKIIQYFCH